jgi:hypothetical protein
MKTQDEVICTLKKEKNRVAHECMLSLPIGSMKILLPKLFVTIFRLG